MKKLLTTAFAITALVGLAAPTVSYRTATNIASRVVAEYDRTNLTARIGAKQDTIEDLDAIREGAAKGGTALQEHQSLEPATNYTDAAVTAATNGLRKVDGAARLLPKYLHFLRMDSSYKDDAEWYYKQTESALAGGCSARRLYNEFQRNYDWNYDESATFVISMSAAADRFASVGVASAGTNLTEEAVTSGRWSRWYKVLPGRTLDGINENGVVCEINVATTNGSPWETHTADRDINAIGAVRWALDNGTNAAQVADALARRVFIPDAMKRLGYSAHFLIADATNTYIVEDGMVYHDIPDVIYPSLAVLTNVRIRMFLNEVDDPYGTGMERMWLLFNLGTTSITNAWFSEAYRRPFTRQSEFAAPGVGTNHYDDRDKLIAWAEEHVPQGAPESLKRNGKTWHTVHTSIYDLTNRVLRVAVQETDDWYTFQVPSAGGVKVETDPTVPAWAKSAQNPSYSKEETDSRLDAKMESNGTNFTHRVSVFSEDHSSNKGRLDIFPNEYTSDKLGSGQLRIEAEGIRLGVIKESDLLRTREFSIDVTDLLPRHRPDWSRVYQVDMSTGEKYYLSDTIGGVGEKADAAQFSADAAQAHSEATRAMISATNTTFSAAVLGVGLNIDPTTLQWLKDIGAIAQSTTGQVGLGTLLAALLAALMWLKANKVQTVKLDDGSISKSSDGGVVKLDDFFGESNSILAATIAAKLAYPLTAYDSSVGLLDRSINVVGSGVSTLTVPNDVKDTLIRLTAQSAVTSITFAASGAKHYGDAFPTAAGDYLVTVTRIEGIASGETAGYYVRTIEMTEAS